MDLLSKANLRRRVEDVDYWRKRAGWFDDDVSMQEYNSGVYDTYYQLGDDDTAARRHHSGSKHGLMGRSSGLMTFFKIGSVILALIFGVLLFRALSRRTSSSRKSSSSKHGSSDSKHRSRSSSRSSRSRSRSRHPSSSASNYDLMDDKSERSKRSSRSRSRSRRHSKSRSSRSRSKSRASKEVLV
jgi:hypothetical protein